MISPHFAEQVLLQGSDGGFYFARQYIDDEGRGQLCWYGEHATLNFSNVFFALHAPDQGAAGRFAGTLYDLPKGRTCAEFNMDLDVVPGRGGRPTTLQQVDGPRSFTVVEPTPEALAAFNRPIRPTPPTFDADDFDNATGLWMGDDGGIYYVLETPNNHRLFWFGAHPSALPGPTGVTGRAFANVFMSNLASREATFARGVYVDVPRGGANARGELNLEFFNDDHHRIRIAYAPDGFGLRELRRIGGMHVRIQWDTLDIVDQQDTAPSIEGDEPMLDIVVAEMDGNTVDLGDLAHASSRISTQFTNALASNVRQGTRLRLALAPHVSFLRPIPGDADGSRQVLALFVGAWDKDLSPSGDHADMFRAWSQIIQWDIDHGIRRDPPVDVRTLGWRRLVRFRWFSDDHLGFRVMAFTWAELVAIARRGRPFPLRFDIHPGGDGNYVVNATMTVDYRLMDACAERIRRG